MDISAVSSAMSSLVAAQGMLPAATRAAAGLNAPSAGAGDGSATEAVQVAVLQKALQMERSLVDILA
jgi:hypothetical protein